MSFEVPEPQVCVHYDDPGQEWHHRILLLAGGVLGRWIACSMDYDVEVMDLADYLVVPLTRASPFLQRILGNTYSQP